MYSQTTNDITVSVEPVYMEEESSPGSGRYFWAYHVTIINHSTRQVQLHERHWKITDSRGLTQEVKGEGVVGQKPILQPGETYSYTSGAPLGTPWGMMVGSYMMRDDAGQSFQVGIPAFSLDSPHQKIVVH